MPTRARSRCWRDLRRATAGRPACGRSAPAAACAPPPAPCGSESARPLVDGGLDRRLDVATGVASWSPVLWGACHGGVLALVSCLDYPHGLAPRFRVPVRTSATAPHSRRRTPRGGAGRPARPRSPICRRWCASRPSRGTASTPSTCAPAPRRSPSSPAGPASSTASRSSRRRFRPTPVGRRQARPAGRARHAAPPATAARRCCSTRTTTCSPRATRRTGTRKPFEPTLRGDRLYGRGAADDKAGVITHIARDPRADLGARRPSADVGIVLFVEGEEEFGSRSLPTILEQYHDAARRRRDRRRRLPATGTSTTPGARPSALRGTVAFNLRVSTLDHASHSGHVRRRGARRDARGDRTARHPLERRTARSRSRVSPRTRPRRPSTTKRSCARRPGCSTASSRSARGDILSRAWYQPSITVTGIDAPSVKNASNTLIPSVRVRVSARVAPGQDARRRTSSALEAHLVEHVAVRRAARRSTTSTSASRSWSTPAAGRPRTRWRPWPRPTARSPCRWDPAGRSRSSPTSCERYPAGADPDHRRRGPGHPGAQPERVAAPADVAARDPRRGAAARSAEFAHAAVGDGLGAARRTLSDMSDTMIATDGRPSPPRTA